MSIFRTAAKQSAVTPDYTGLQIQTAVNALPIPILWGESKLAPNVIWYNNFQTIPQQSGGGGGGKGGIFRGGGTTTGYTYTASVIMALCEGPIAAINQIWRGQSLDTLAGLGFSLFTGTTPQTAWSYLATVYPSQSLAYQGTAYVCAANYDLSDSATLDNHNFEVQGFRYGSGANGVDADPAQIVSDFLTNAQYGIGFPASSIAATTLFGSGGDASYQTYCAAVGFALSPALTDQERASSILGRWLQLTNTAAVWSGGLLKFIPYGDTATVAGAATTTTISLVLPALGAFITSTPQVYVMAPSRFSADLGVRYSVSGTAFTFIGAGVPLAAGTYGISPNGTYVFANADANAGVSITYQYTSATSFVPDVAPIYDLDDDDFKAEANGDPLQVTRSDPYEAYNVWRIEIAERVNAYNLTTVESRDQNAIELYGMRIASTVTAHEICDPNVALISGQLMVQRAVYIRNTYQFRLSWEYCLLDPMDLVTVTDSILGLANAPIRITAIEEDEKGFLQVSAEEFPLGTATATLYATQAVTNVPINRNVTPDPVNAPIIFEPPSALVGATAQVWIAASGGLSGLADPNWGGALVWLSLDGASYTQIGTIASPSRQGVLTASLPAFSGTNPDTADTLAVNMAESAGILSSATALDAQLTNTLCVVDEELLSYETATLTAANHYSLTTMYRGLYGTAITAHSPGAPFARLDSSVFEYDLPPQFVGQTLYIKLQSFNVFGGGVQELSSCAVYTYTPSGAALDHPIARALLVSTSMDFGLVTEAAAADDDFGAPPALVVELDVDLGVA
ncbi:MAG: phage tail protein [Xanthobacteraceae bacterium]